MNNNNRGNNNNNRRRGRGNNRQQGGGGQQLNRIDSRSRGNAQQMLDKFRKLAHDAHLNDDRVQEEYYLQFADHYFRVLADQRLRQEETRQRRDGAPQDGSERPRYDEPRGRDDYGEYADEPGDDEPARPESREQRGDDYPRGGYDADSSRGDSARRDSLRSDSPRGDNGDVDGEAYEPAGNPFVRESRSPRPAAKPRAPRRESRSTVSGDDARGEERSDQTVGGFDASILPPPIGASSEVDAEEAPAKPRRRVRKPRDAGGSDESLEAVS